MRRNTSRTVAIPSSIAAIYVVFGSLYILLSDSLVFLFVESSILQSQIQTVKGWGFVAISGILIFMLSRYQQERLQSINEELTGTVQQVHILHRLLRHNLRNKCNIILGNADRILTDGGVDAAETIKDQTNELVELSEKTGLFQEASIEEPHLVSVNLVPMVTDVVAEFAQTRPNAEIQTDLPPEAIVRVHPRIRSAIHELILNGITHSGEKSVTIRLTDDDETGTISVLVIDRGPGLPPVEREVLADGFLETPTKHSLGIGIWVVRYLVSESGGTLSVETDDEGTAIEVVLQEPQERAIDKFFQ